MLLYNPLDGSYLFLIKISSPKYILKLGKLLTTWGDVILIFKELEEIKNITPFVFN